MKVTHILTSIALMLAFSGAVYAQNDCPQGMVCLSQTAAQVAASNARELFAIREKVAVLESSLIEKDKIADAIRGSATKNEADLKAAIVKTEIALSMATGQLIEAKADKTMYIGLIEYLTKNQRAKKTGLINIW